jgi:hypothetical protein
LTGNASTVLTQPERETSYAMQAYQMQLVAMLKETPNVPVIFFRKRSATHYRH